VGNFDLAVDTYEQACLLAPTYSYLPYNLGLLYQQMNEVSEARKAYKQALQLAQNDCSASRAATCSGAARVLTALGVLNETEGKKRRAERLYRSALREDPNLLEAKHDLAALWTRSKKQDFEAEKLWMENLGVEPNHLPSLIGLSELLLKRAELRKSLPYYERILQLRPDYAPAILAVAEIRTATEDPRLALLMLDDKEPLLHDNPDFWAARTEAHLSLHDLKLARTDYSHALQTAHSRQQRTALEKEFKDRLRAPQ
jgi:Tetratricopeptide repeat